MSGIFRNTHRGGHRHMHGRPHGFGRGKDARQFYGSDDAPIINSAENCPFCERRCALSNPQCGKGASYTAKNHTTQEVTDE